MSAPLSSFEFARLHDLGVGHFNAGAYFAAHEAWEELWRALPEGEVKQSYQVLIQMAVALELFRRSIPAGVVRTRQRYLARLAKVSPGVIDVNLQALSSAMDACLEPLLAAVPLPERGAVSFDFARAPRIKELYNGVIARGL